MNDKKKGRFFWTSEKPLFYAIVENNYNLFKRELDKNVDDVDLEHHTYGSALHYAIRLKRTDMCTLLASLSKNLNSPDLEGRTPLGLALSYSDHKIVKLLLDHGADPNVLDGDGLDILHEAVFLERCEILQDLIDAGAKIDYRDFEGYTPLHTAVILSSKECIKVLLENGASLNVKNNAGQSPLDIASHISGQEIILLPSEDPFL